MSGSALAELCEALGELGEALYIEKLPINRPSGRYVCDVRSQKTMGATLC